jgi:hypothetical protein
MLSDSFKTISLGNKWFKIGSPEDGVGIEIPSFRLYQTYRLDRDRLAGICESLYDKVYQAVNEGSLGNARTRVVFYRKDTLELDDRRKYILVTRDTAHGIRTTIFIRFLSFGDNLYVGLDVYVLGGLNWLKFLLKLAFSLILIPWILLGIPLIVIIVIWWKLFWRVQYEGKFWLALRQEFPGKVESDSFDSDDTLMFSKTTLHMAIRVIRDVFQEEEIPLDSLDYYASSINNVSNISISTGGGAFEMIGSALGNANSVK